jgi:GNAT superfamily N-acetyltransferase
VSEREDGHTVTLRDGTHALVRPIRPDDKWRLVEGLKLLSPRTRYLRFHADIDAFTPEQLAYLTEVDHQDHEAWVALDPEDLDAPGWGVARYVRLASDPTVAEAAVTVVDEVQGRGLGTILLRQLAVSAIENGIRTFRNYVLAENETMLEVFDQVGAVRRELPFGVLQVDVALPDDPALLPVPGIRELFRELARGLLPPVIWRFPWNARWRHGPLDWLREDAATDEDPAADEVDTADETGAGDVAADGEADGQADGRANGGASAVERGEQHPRLVGPPGRQEEAPGEA